MWRWYGFLSVAKNSLARGSVHDGPDGFRPAIRSVHVGREAVFLQLAGVGDAALLPGRESCIKKGFSGWAGDTDVGVCRVLLPHVPVGNSCR